MKKYSDKRKTQRLIHNTIVLRRYERLKIKVIDALRQNVDEEIKDRQMLDRSKNHYS